MGSFTSRPQVKVIRRLQCVSEKDIWTSENTIFKTISATKSMEIFSEPVTSVLTWRKETIVLAKPKTSTLTSVTSERASNSSPLKKTSLKTTVTPLDPHIKSGNHSIFNPKEPTFILDSSDKGLREPYPIYNKKSARREQGGKDSFFKLAIFDPTLPLAKVKYQDEEASLEKLLNMSWKWSMFILEGVYWISCVVINVVCLYKLYPGLMGYKRKI
ncbi:hypothetical protein K501DRAFT_267602 [Backusella circina FSU 941]|nr:hypothetical protein K501DRAFT_267602 [Backusella circina FSU 941]